MDYFDSKVLESFLIPEYEVANEGIGRVILNAISGLIKMLRGFINSLIGAIKNCIAKLKSKKAKESIKIDKNINGNIFTNETVTLSMAITNISNKCELSIGKLFILLSTYNSNANDKSETENNTKNEIDKSINELLILTDDFNKKYDKYKNNYTNKQIYIYETNKNKVIESFTQEINHLEMQKKKLDGIQDKVNNYKGTDITKFTNIAINNISKSINIANKASTEIITLINSAEIISNNSNNSKSSNEKSEFDISQSLKNAINSKDIEEARNAIINYINADPDNLRGDAYKAIQYAVSHGINVWEPHDNNIPMNKDQKAWDTDYAAHVTTTLYRNFSKERFSHWQNVAKYNSNH